MGAGLERMPLRVFTDWYGYGQTSKEGGPEANTLTSQSNGQDSFITIMYKHNQKACALLEPEAVSPVNSNGGLTL